MESSTAESNAENSAAADDSLSIALPSPTMRRMANTFDAANRANAVNAKAATDAPNDRNPSAASAICAMTGDSANFILASGLHEIRARYAANGMA